MTASNFSSVKLSADLVQQARDAAQPLRRSAAGQIEYWAMLGRVVEHSGLTVQDARLAIENYEAAGRLHPPVNDSAVNEMAPDSLESVKQRVLAASSDGTLKTQIQRIVADNRQKADLRKAA